MKKFLSVFLLVTVVCCFGALIIGCEQIDNEGEPSVEIEQEVPDYPVYVRQMTFNEAPKTVVSLSPALTEIMSELGYEDKLIGRSSYCDYPETVLQKADIGSSANPDIDAIIKLAPEVVISQSPIAKKDISKLEKSNIRVLIISYPNNFPELLKNYSDIAMVMGGAKNAEKIASEKVAPLQEALMELSPKVKFAYIMTRELSICPGGTLANDILSYFGTNIAADNKQYTLTPEELAKADPDVLFLAAPMNIANLDASVNELRAAKAGNVFAIDNISFERPTARRILNLVNSLKTTLENVEPLPPEETTVTETSETEETKAEE